jgi:hypothetical protein
MFLLAETGCELQNILFTSFRNYVIGLYLVSSHKVLFAGLLRAKMTS